MLSEEEMEIRLTHLEDQLNRMNLVLARQERKLDTMVEAVNKLANRFKIIEDASAADSSVADSLYSPSERPPDGINR